MKAAACLAYALTLAATGGAWAHTGDTPPAVGADLAPAIRPFEVIDRAIVRWQARPRPAFLSYTVDFRGSQSDRPYRRRFRVDYTVATHDARVTTLDSQGTAPAFVEPEKQRFSPIETFGFVQRDTAVGGGVAPSPLPNVPVIAAVHATVRYPYDVKFVGMERIDEQAVYHLMLDPRRTPDAYPLRDVWIDAQTYDVLKVVALQFDRLGPIRVPYRVTATYRQEGPYWLIHSAQAGATIHAGLFTYGSSAKASFEDFQYVP